MWNYEEWRAWRWRDSFAWLPVNTIDAGWVWFKGYHRWQCIWGWGFFEDFPYLNKPETGHVP